MLKHLSARIAKGEARQSQLDAKIAALDGQIFDLEQSWRDEPPDRDAIARVGRRHCELADLLYELGGVDALLDQARARAGTMATPSRSAPSQRLRAWAQKIVRDA
jgi:hypothetical protein